MMEFNAARIIAAAESRTCCVRCRAEVHHTDGPHLCADLSTRYDRQVKAIAEVRRITGCTEEQAYRVVKVLSGRGLIA